MNEERNERDQRMRFHRMTFDRKASTETENRAAIIKRRIYHALVVTRIVQSERESATD